MRMSDAHFNEHIGHIGGWPFHGQMKCQSTVINGNDYYQIVYRSPEFLFWSRKQQDYGGASTMSYIIANSIACQFMTDKLDHERAQWYQWDFVVRTMNYLRMWKDLEAEQIHCTLFGRLAVLIDGRFISVLFQSCIFARYNMSWDPSNVLMCNFRRWIEQLVDNSNLSDQSTKLNIQN